MAFCTLFSCANHIYAPLQKFLEIPIRVISKQLPVAFNKGFQLRKKNSMGFISGEWGGRYTSLTPASKHMHLIRSEWWKDALSITNTDLGSGHLPQWWRSCSIKSSKIGASVEPRKTRERSTPSWQYTGKIWYRWPRWNLATWTGVTSSGAQPVRRYLICLSHPDSSM